MCEVQDSDQGAQHENNISYWLLWVQLKVYWQNEEDQGTELFSECLVPVCLFNLLIFARDV